MLLQFKNAYSLFSVALLFLQWMFTLQCIPSILYLQLLHIGNHSVHEFKMGIVLSYKVEGSCIDSK